MIHRDHEPAFARAQTGGEPTKELRRDKVGGGLLLALGLLTLGTAIYFLAIRPPMLPEDTRFTGLAADAVSPRMADWLSIVFHTWGGFMAGFGILILGVAGYLMTLRPAFIRWGAAVAVVVAFGRFLASNIALRSDFLPFVVTLAAFALLAALWLALRR
jgi:hypothetical protein